MTTTNLTDDVRLLESAITQAITAFSQKTGFSVESISVSSIDLASRCGPHKSVACGVSVSIKPN